MYKICKSVNCLLPYLQKTIGYRGMEIVTIVTIGIKLKGLQQPLNLLTLITD